VLQNTDRYFDRHVARSISASDIDILSSPMTRQRTHAMLAERTAITMDGMVEENILNAQGWDFDVANIRLPVTIFHGTTDNVAPIPGARLLAEHLPNGDLYELPDFGHYHIFTQWACMVSAAAGLPFEPPVQVDSVAMTG
jgi:pimeloyl-ACP methyl ester carboxylesterase